MKILKNERDGNKVTLEIEESAEEFTKAINDTLNETVQDMKIPGFRKGKAPRSIVEKNINQEAVDNHSAQNLIGDLYPQIIRDLKISPVDYPKIELKQLERGKPLIFSIEIEVYPEIKLGNYKGLKAEKKSTEVKEEDVLNVMGDLQNRLAKWVEVKDRAVKEGDVVDLTLQAEAGTPWPRDLQFYPVGSKYISAEFDSELVGLTLEQEKEFKIQFKEDYPVKEVAGKEISFKVKLLKISEKELLPLDDGFAKKISKHGTLAEFKAELTKNLEEEKREEAEADLKNQLLDEVSKNTDIEVPRPLVDNEIQIMLDELKASLSHSNLTMENYLKSVEKSEEDVISEFVKPATARVKGKMILKAVAEAEKLEVAEKELKEELARYSGREKLTEGQLDYVKDYLLRRKALDFLINNATISRGG